MTAVPREVEDAKYYTTEGLSEGWGGSQGGLPGGSDFYFNLILFFKLYIIVLVLPNIKMNKPQVYMCSPS